MKTSARCLAAAVTLVFTITTAHAQQPKMGLPPVAAAPDQPRSLTSIELLGLQTIPVEVLRSKLANSPEIVEATHPSIDGSTFEYRVREAIMRGFVSSGFHDCRVAVTKSDKLSFRITEGPRFLRGDIRVRGATERANQWLRNRLLNLTTTDDKPKLIWQPGKPFSGLLFAKLELQQTIRDRLGEWGIDGNNAAVDFSSDDDSHRVSMDVHLAQQDSTWLPPSQESPARAAPDATSDSPSKTSKVLIEEQLTQIYETHFAKPLRGVVVTTRDDQAESRIGFGQDSTWAEFTILRDREDPAADHVIRFVLDAKQSLISAQPTAKWDSAPASTWRLPAMTIGFVLTQKANAESEGKHSMSLSFSTNFGTDKKNTAPVSCGIDFSPQGWREWFPAESTTVSRSEKGTVYRFGSHQLHLDPRGKFISLRGSRAGSSSIEILATEQDAMHLAAQKLIDESSAQDILVCDPSTGDTVTLNAVFDKASVKNAKSHDFFIPPANGKKGVWGVLLLDLVNHETLVPKESLIGQLATLYALQLSGYSRTLPERMDVIQANAMTGPIASLALANLAQQMGQLERAKDLYANSLLLSQHIVSVERDIDRLLSEHHLLGQVARNIDIKALLELGLRLAATDPDRDTSFLQNALSMMPNASDDRSRRENCKQVVHFLYLAKLDAVVRQTCQSKISQIETKQERIAAKAKKKKDDLKKKPAKKR